MTEPHDHTAHLEDLLARCLPYVESVQYEAEALDATNAAKRHAHLITEIRKAVPWLKERDE